MVLLFVRREGIYINLPKRDLSDYIDHSVGAREVFLWRLGFRV